MPKRHAALRSLRTVCSFFGYLNLTMAWVWISVLLLPRIMDSGILDQYTSQTTAPLAPAPNIEATPFTTALAVIIVTGLLVMTVITLIKLPRSFTKSADKAVHKVSSAAVPMVTHHKKLAEKKRRTLSLRLAFLIQCGLLVIPMTVSFFVPTTKEITREIIVTITLVLGISGVLWFGLALLCAKYTISRTRSHVFRG